MKNFWPIWAAFCIAAVTATFARAEVVTDLAPFTWDSTRPDVLVFEGEITRRTPPLLGLALGRFEQVEVLQLSSPGGDAYAAMAMVPTIRAAGLATRIEAGDKCHSACSFLYFAGSERAAEGELGVHQLASANEASGHFIMNDVLDVFTDLGLPDTVRRRMMQTPPSEMYVFSSEELAALGLVGPADNKAPSDPAPPIAAAPDPAASDPAEADPAPPAAIPDAPATHLVLDIAGEANGRVVIELFDTLAPEHAARLVTLAREGAYDGVVFHRVIDGFMAQTGDVEFGKVGGDLARAGTGGSSYPDLPAEFSDTPFVAGTVGMARAQDPDSANSQFFITFAPAPYLDGTYTVVGQVVEGFDVVQAIKQGGGDNGGVTGEPDRIVRALALSGPDGPASVALAPAPKDPADIPRFDMRFDFTEPGQVGLEMGWALPPELAETTVCDGGDTRTLDNGFTECLVTMSEAEETMLRVGSSGGITFSAGDDGSRALELDVLRFLEELTPSSDEANNYKDMRFTFAVVSGQILETTGEVTADGSSANLVLTLQQIAENRDTIPATFTTRFR